LSGIQERDLGSLKGLPERFAEAPGAAETIEGVTRRAMAPLAQAGDRFLLYTMAVGSNEPGISEEFA
jgi:hypothetical protein